MDQHNLQGQRHLTECQLDEYEMIPRLTWKFPPQLYAPPSQSTGCTVLGSKDVCACLERTYAKSYESQFRQLLGDRHQIALLINESLSESLPRLEDECFRQRRAYSLTHVPILKTLVPERLEDYFQHIATGEVDLADRAWLGANRGERWSTRNIWAPRTLPNLIRLICGQTSSALFKSLLASAIANIIYEQFPNVTIPLRLVDRPLGGALWLPDVPTESMWLNMDRCRTFACIAMFESGGLNIDPSHLSRVFALSSRNSLLVAGTILSDPSSHLDGIRVRKITGNIGTPGISMLVGPTNPRVRAQATISAQ
jgi:hypothetical protein